MALQDLFAVEGSPACRIELDLAFNTIVPPTMPALCVGILSAENVNHPQAGQPTARGSREKTGPQRKGFCKGDDSRRISCRKVFDAALCHRRWLASGSTDIDHTKPALECGRVREAALPGPG